MGIIRFYLMTYCSKKPPKHWGTYQSVLNILKQLYTYIYIYTFSYLKGLLYNLENWPTMTTLKFYRDKISTLKIKKKIP